MVMYRADACVCVVLTVVAGVSASHLADSDYQERYLRNLKDFSRLNLTYECLPYSDRNQVPECDCLACASASVGGNSFAEKMCELRAAQTDPRPYRRTETEPDKDWHKICDATPNCRKPTECCDPSKGLQMAGGCPTCVPTVDSRTAIGRSAACFVAEQQTPRKSGADWKQTYQHYVDAMTQAKLSEKCISYALVRTAGLCDCEPCLESETSIRSLREKLCEMGRVVRSKSELNRRDFWGHNDYFLNFCDFDKCPEMPRSCCRVDDAEAARPVYAVDSEGCPSCLPTSSHYGFGPQCDSKLNKFSQANRNSAMKILEELAH